MEHREGHVEGEDFTAEREGVYAAHFRAALQHAVAELLVGDRALLRHHLVERMTAERIAATLGTPRVMIDRRLSRIRRRLQGATREHLMQTLALEAHEVDGILRLVQGEMDVGLRRLLRSRCD